jgi:hypothetical protein
MTPDEQAAQARLKQIADQQAAFEVRVKALQDTLTDLVLNGADTWLKQPEKLDAVLLAFTKGPMTSFVSAWARDLLQGSLHNAQYFEAVAYGLASKDYEAISIEAKQLVYERFGIKPNGKLTGKGYFDTVLNDKALIRKVKDAAWTAKSSGVGVDQFKRDIKGLIKGNASGKGLVERHFDTFAYDTYQSSDAQIQDFYAQKLDLPAALYLGGEITGTRPFCHERNGKVFLKAEIEDMRMLKFAGKTNPYDPFIDRGGYRCRHHWHWITAKQAVRRDSTLSIDESGKLIRKAG